jgi:hypothetical protein
MYNISAHQELNFASFERSRDIVWIVRYANDVDCEHIDNNQLMKL